MRETVEILLSAGQIQKRVGELAEEITADYGGKVITMVCILKGGVVFLTDLARKVNGPVEFEFMDVSSYGNGTVGGEIEFRKDVEGGLDGKNVLLVEDIIDTGNTIGFICDHLRAKNPATFKVCALLDKPERRVLSGLRIDYTGFVIPDRFVVGYGLDYAQRYRNLDHVGILKFED
ncbi:MAG: hypoxanthine phosphoribosyltransferase [Firmicutes bacterium]|nr:hypoxanthine phosphoribosyltransferase [Bacillota bacterium]